MVTFKHFLNAYSVDRIANQSQLLPYGNDCRNSFQLFKTCRHKSLAVRACSGVVKNTKTVRCLGTMVMAIFNHCLSQVCGGSLCNLDFEATYGCHAPLTFTQERKKNCQKQIFFRGSLFGLTPDRKGKKLESAEQALSKYKSSVVISGFAC